MWEAADSKFAKVLSTDPATIKRLDSLCRSNPAAYKEAVKEDSDDLLTRYYDVDIKYIRFAKPRPEATEKQRAARRNAIKYALAARGVQLRTST